MLTRPIFKSGYRVEVVRGEGVLLLSARGDQVLSGSLYEHLVPWLSGGNSSDEIVAGLAAEHEPAEVYYALLALEDRGCLDESGAATWESGAAPGPPAGASSGRARRRVPRQAIALRTVGRLRAGEWATALERAGFVVRETAAVIVTLTDDYLQPELEAINQRALQARQSWLLVKPCRLAPWIGPLFVPGATCCWKCLEHRLQRNRPVRSYWWNTRRRSPSCDSPVVIETPPCTAVDELLIAWIARGVAAGSRGRLAGAVLAREPGATQLRRHTLAQRPQCPACGDATLYAQQVLRPLRLERRRKKVAAGVDHRSASTRETVRALTRLVSPITGVIRTVRAIDGRGAAPLHAYVAEHAAAADWDTVSLLRRGLRPQSGGKGPSDVQARASALGEAIERYSGAVQGDEPRVTSSFAQMRDRAIHPNTCMQFSESQYRGRAEWNRRVSARHWVPMPFDPTAPVEWTPVWSLTHRCHKYLPTRYLYYSSSRDPARPFCRADSNGCAAGHTREDAILRGFLELVERDSVALWWYNRVQRPALDLESLRSSWFRKLRAHYGSLGRECWALDITSDLGIPCFVALSRQVGQPLEKIVLGFGAHCEPRRAVLHALTEMNQMLALVLAFERERRRFATEQEAWLAEATVAGHSYLRPGPFPPTRVTECPHAHQPDVREEVRWCQRVVERRGMELLVLDQTRPDVDLAVVRVIVPGLRHFWARFAAGRLYDAPVALGWVAKPQTEADLNPVPMFL